MNKGCKMMLVSAVFALSLSATAVMAMGLPPTVSDKPDNAAPLTSQVGTTVETGHLAEEGTRLIGVVEKKFEGHGQTEYDLSAISALVASNRVFGDDIYDDSAVIDAVQITLLSRATEIDGFLFIEKQTVNDAIYNMYGRTVDEAAGEIYGLEAPDGYYAILPRSYDLMSHTVTDVAKRDDGRLSVTTELTVAGLDTAEVLTAQTLLAPAQTESGYIIESAQIVE